MEIDASQYRERSTADIVKEQRELERLRRVAMMHGAAWWEFHGLDYKFAVSDSWKALTGYELKDIFPTGLSPDTNPVEPKLDNLIDKFCSLVVQSDRQEFKTKAADFLLWSQESQVFDSGFTMRRKDGTEITVWAVAHSVWEDGKLQSLFCQLRDIQRLISPVGSAVAISKTSDKLTEVSGKVKNLSAWTSSVKTWWPLILIGAVTFVDGVELLVTQTVRLISVVTAPIISARNPMLGTTSLLPRKITSAELDEALSEMKPAGKFGTVTLAAYGPGVLPGQYQPIIQTSNRQDLLFDQGTRPISLSKNKLVAEMADAHLSDRAFVPELPEGYLYSEPFTITREDGQPQTFFVEIEADDADSAAEIQREVVRLTGIIEEIFRLN